MAKPTSFPKRISTTCGYERTNRHLLLPNERKALAIAINEDCIAVALAITTIAKKHKIKPRTVARIAIAHIEGLK